MNRVLGAILLLVGIILISYGLRAMDSPASQVEEFFTGTPTDESMWLMIGGVVCAILGLFALLRGERA
jgi:hypothetical protein